MGGAVLACIFAFAATFPAASAAEPAPAPAAGTVPDADTLRVKMKEAEGKAPERERLRLEFVRDGIGGTSTEYRDGKNYRTVDAIGPLHSEYGEYDGQAWFQNENGETVLRQKDPGAATTDRLTARVTRVSTPVDAYVLSSLNVRGEGARTFVDPVTYRVVRRERISATDTRVTVYDDFRTVDGVTRASHSHSDDGYAVNAVDERVVGLDENVAAADLKIPGGRAFVEFPAGTTSVQLPARKTRDEKFLVRVDVAGRGLDFILDTGAGGITIDDDVAKQLALKTYARGSSAANAGRILERHALIPEMSVGSLKMHDVAVTAVPSIRMESAGDYKAVGLLGFDFIADVALRLDYEKGTVTAFAPSAFAPPPESNAIAVPVRIGSGMPETDVTVNGALGERFGIDTGGAGGLMIFDYFARRHPEALVDEGHHADFGPHFYGVGGSFNVQPLQLKSVRLGQVNFSDFVAYRVTSKSYNFSTDGILGTEFLHYFTMYTDYGNSTVYLVPNTLGRLSGLR